MALLLPDCTFFGPALPEPFVKFELERLLRAKDLLAEPRGEAGRLLDDQWEAYRRKLRALGEQGGERRVVGHVLEPLGTTLGYHELSRAEDVATREGAEEGGWLFCGPEGASLRAWAVSVGTDLDAPARRGRAYRFSPVRVAQRVLLAAGERVGLLTDGEELRLLLAEPSRPDSHIVIRLDRSGGWRAARAVPDSYRLLLALASPAGVRAVPDLVEAARLSQSTVTDKLRVQARLAVEAFVQEVLDQPVNHPALATHVDRQALARTLWSEGLVLVYRLLFVLKLESSADPARAFSFASTSLWRNTFSPNTALAPFARRVLDQGAATTPTLDGLAWGERAVARLLDHLLWTPGDGRTERERVHYGALDVEDLGRVYEALLELEPGIATEPMARLRRAKLEVVLPAVKAAPFRASTADDGADEADTDEDESDDDAPAARGGSGTRVRFVEDIAAGRFYLRVGLGRKATGSYYTPHPFVRFLVQETLGPQVAERSPPDEPQPAGILALKVLDPAMGSGHFLVEACRYLGDALYEACRLCDERALEAEEKAGKAQSESEREPWLTRAAELRRRVEALPDPDDELVAYLPSRVPEGEASGLSQRKAEALCRRLVAVHCLYGVDKNPLAVELAKLSLWLESYAEGLPLTFLDHRLVRGDALTGPFFEHLLTWPRSGQPIHGLFEQGLTDRLTATLNSAMAQVHALEASVGKDVADLEQKRQAKERLDAALAPFRLLAAAWAGGVMVGESSDDTAYGILARAVADGNDTGEIVAARPTLRYMIAVGRESVPFDLIFPEVFFKERMIRGTGFHAVLGNPPWDALQPLAKEFFAAFDLRIIDAPTRRERMNVERRLVADAAVQTAYDAYLESFERTKRTFSRAYSYVGRQAGGRPSGAALDIWQGFAERGAMLLADRGRVGWVLPSAFHANHSATGIRELYLERMALRCCYSFENRNELFKIHRSFKFAVVVTENDPAGAQLFNCAFYIQNLDWLFPPKSPLTYSPALVRATSGDSLAFIELRTQRDLEIAQRVFGAAWPFGEYCATRSIVMGRELHMSDDAQRFTATASLLNGDEDPRNPMVAQSLRQRGYLPLQEGKTFHQFKDQWEGRPRYIVATGAIVDKPEWLKAARYYRLAMRSIARSTDERTAIFCLFPPGSVFGHSAAPERQPWSRPNVRSLVLLSIGNTLPFDWVLRQKGGANVSQFILNGCPVPQLHSEHERLLAHCGLRLSGSHSGYAALWHEQLGDIWREPTPPKTWPVLAGDDARWTVRAVIDAVVAQAYGLNREQYAHVLGSFTHRSYPKAPELCLAAYDELTAIGFEAFCRKHDPYWDIPLNENLPKPVIDLPIPNSGGRDTPSSVAEAVPQYSLFGADGEPAGHPAARERRQAPARQARPAGQLNDEIYQRIAALLTERGVITSGDAQQLTGLDAAGVRPYLARLVEESRAVTEGQRRGTRYRLAR